MDDFTNDLIQAQYKAELGQALSDKFDACTNYIMLASMLEVPDDVIDKLNLYAHDFDHFLTLAEKQYIIEQSLIDSKFNLGLFNSKFPTGPLVEVYPEEYATKAEYAYILINPLRSNHGQVNFS